MLTNAVETTLQSELLPGERLLWTASRARACACGP
jgi:hypothetical protein